MGDRPTAYEQGMGDTPIAAGANALYNLPTAAMLQLGEAARAFTYIQGEGPIDSAKVAEWAANNRGVADELRARIAVLRGQPGTEQFAGDLDALMSELDGEKGAPPGTIRLQSIAQTIEALAAKAGMNATELASRTREQRMEQAWNKIKAKDEEIDKDLETMRARGLISDDEYERLKKLKEEAYKYPVGSKEWQEANDHYNMELDKTHEELKGKTQAGSGDRALTDGLGDNVDERKKQTEAAKEAQKAQAARRVREQALEEDEPQTPTQFGPREPNQVQR